MSIISKRKKEEEETMRTVYFSTLLLISFCFLAFPKTSAANKQAEQLMKLMKSTVFSRPAESGSWLDGPLSPVYVGSQDGLMAADKINDLPGQPKDVDFMQYGGYVTVDPANGRALFYYFAESPQNSTTKPLVLWLNGGPGCSSLGYGAFEEIGPFRVKSDGKTLYRNKYAWNNVANMLFLESPVGVGFSYSNTSTDYFNNGDNRTADDSYTFLVNWFERFPQYKGRDFFITGESYAGHYVPQLAANILRHNKGHNQTVINLRGVAIGNAYVDGPTNMEGTYEFQWGHALISDEAYSKIREKCNFSAPNNDCSNALSAIDIGSIDRYNIYAPNCRSTTKHETKPEDETGDFDPCTDNFVFLYLNEHAVQKSLHAKARNWNFCTRLSWGDRPSTTVPIIKNLIESGLTVWLYSGDTDGIVPITATKYALKQLDLPISNKWRPWYSSLEVGGYVVEYKGLVLVTVRGAGHMVPSYQPERALTMISCFLNGKLPPAS